VVFVRMLGALMRIHAYLGDLHESRREAVDLHRLASEHGFVWNEAWANHQLGAIAYEWNDLDAAFAHFSEVVAKLDKAHTAALLDASFGLALTQRARGFETEAWLTLEHLQDVLRQTANREQLTIVRALQRHFSPVQSEVVEVSGEPSGRAQRSSVLIVMLGNPDVIRVQALLKLATVESLNEAEALLDDLLRYARALHVTSREIELLALQSVLAQTRGQTEDAADTLECALGLGARGGYVLATVLRTLRPRSRHGAYIDALLAAFEAEPPAIGRSAVSRPLSSVEAVDVLTDREIEILEKLAARFSYKEIADALVI